MDGLTNALDQRYSTVLFHRGKVDNWNTAPCVERCFSLSQIVALTRTDRGEEDPFGAITDVLVNLKKQENKNSHEILCSCLLWQRLMRLGTFSGRCELKSMKVLNLGSMKLQSQNCFVKLIEHSGSLRRLELPFSTSLSAKQVCRLTVVSCSNRSDELLSQLMWMLRRKDCFFPFIVGILKTMNSLAYLSYTLGQMYISHSGFSKERGHRTVLKFLGSVVVRSEVTQSDIYNSDGRLKFVYKLFTGQNPCI